ncbi:MAG: WhiB family transcriptional regulator [Acidimicrobiales bacterium]
MSSALRTTELWQTRAACRGPHAASIFFPPSHVERAQDRAEREALAKAICDRCSVRRECLDYALRGREPHGVWGGLNELERESMASSPYRTVPGCRP